MDKKISFGGGEGYQLIEKTQDSRQQNYEKNNNNDAQYSYIMSHNV